jgi:hypothetical protein
MRDKSKKKSGRDRLRPLIERVNRPKAEIAALRSYLRHRESLIQAGATHMNRIEKALLQMNLQLHLVISDLAGLTGMRILRDIVGGERDPPKAGAPP